VDGRKRRVGSREWTLLTLITRAGVWRRGRPDKPAIPSDVQAIRTPAAAGQSECGAAPPCDGDDRAGGAKAAIETNTRDPIVLQQQTVDAAGPLLVDNLSDSAPHVLEMLSRAPDCATDMARPRHRRHLRVKASDSGRRSRDPHDNERQKVRTNDPGAGTRHTRRGASPIARVRRQLEEGEGSSHTGGTKSSSSSQQRGVCGCDPRHVSTLNRRIFLRRNGFAAAT